MSFCTAVNCMDGRVQEPVVAFLKKYFNVEYVDMITEPGPVRFLAEEQQSETTASILERIDISAGKHKSIGIAIIAHYDCAGNPQPQHVQKEQLKTAKDFVKSKYPQLPVIMLWVDADWQVGEVE